MTDKFTPGPWFVRRSMHGPRYRCVQIGADPIYRTLEIEPADARLIAAAPDLLAALRKLVAAHTDLLQSDYETSSNPNPAGTNVTLIEARAAIVKATGDKQ